jgi:hypothetical protein
MASKVLKLQLALVFLGSLGLACSSNKTETGTPDSSTPDGNSNSDGDTCSLNTSEAIAFGKQYAFANTALSGWQQEEAGSDIFAYWTGPGTNLHCIIDGSQPDYTENHGCLLAMYQTLLGPDSQSCRVAAMDFGTETKATDMFTYEQKQTSASIPIPSYDTSVAVAYHVIDGITVYAHSKASYFELQLTGYSDDATAAQAAKPFLDILKAKTN